jgi:hypothetical protein
MAERNTDSPLAKPDYRLWLSYFCLPLLMILLGSVVLWVVQKRTGLTDWSGLLNYVRNNCWNWDWNLSTVLATVACLFILLSLTQLLLGTYRWVCFRIRRIDLWLCASTGIFAGLLLAPLFSSRYPDWLLDPSSVLWLLLYGLLLLPFFGILRQLDRLSAKQKSTVGNLSRIQSDAPIDSADQDLFEWSGKATAFGGEVLYAPDGTAFGVEAPWGTGKTSFINLCEQNWRDKYPEFTVAVYRFELLKYAGNPDFIQQFVLGLLESLQQHYYLPELSGAVQGYLGSLQGALELSGGPLKLTLNNQPNSIEEALDQIKAQLDRRLPQNFRLVVVIDDLDRAEPSSVCDLLFALHKCFALPRLRYVLCYDQQQLAHKAEQHRQHGGDLSSQTLYEFLDKFVGARVYLHATYAGLQKYVEDELLPQLESRPDIPEQWQKFIRVILLDGALPLLRQMDNGELLHAHIKRSKGNPLSVEQNHVYWHLLGDVRKLKWFYNQICLCWQDGLDLSKHDFNPRDLVYLLLLQQSFSQTFRTLQAQAHSGEYLSLALDTSEDDVKAGQGLEKFIEKEKDNFKLTPWQQDRLEALLRGLFDPKVRSKDDEQKNVVRAASSYRLPEYFHLLLQERIPALHSSQTYRTWLRWQWSEKGEPLKNLLKEDALREHDKVVDDWQDEHEYVLWEVLLGQFNQYTPQQQKELLTEYLQALPRFCAIGTLTRRRVAMVSLLGQLIADNHAQGQGILKQVWIDLPNAMLHKDRSTDVLLGYRDAMLVCFKISRQDTALARWAHKVLWGKFQKRYLEPPLALQKDLPTIEALTGTRNRQILAKPVDQVDQCISLSHIIKSIWVLSIQQKNTTLCKKIEDWLFNVCWGEGSPDHEQVAWWLDFLLYNWAVDIRRDGLTLSLEGDLRLRMQAFSQQHAAKIEEERQQLRQNILHGDHKGQNKAEVLHKALTELHGKNWDEIVVGGSNASAAGE